MRTYALGLFAALVAAPAFAAPTFTTIDNPGDPTFNQLLGITNAGVISGYFGSGAAGHPNKGYTVSPPYGTFKDANVPTSTQTQATGINGTTVVGFWSPTNLGGGDANFGFIRTVTGGQFVYTLVDDPLTTSNPPVNQVLGINAAGLAAGFYNDAAGASHGFVYTVSTGVYTPVTVPGAVSAAATGINANNLLCGFFTNGAGRTLGFTKSLTGSAIRFGVPNSPNTQFLGINKNGVAVGFYVDAANNTHGVIYNPANGNWNPVDAPNGVQGTVLNGINDKGKVVGFYTDAGGNTHGMLVNGLVTP